MAKLDNAKMGRPSKYTKKLGEQICNKIASGNEGLHVICENDKFPSATTVYNWLNNENNKEFLEKYTRARLDQADFLADEIIKIADTPKEGVIMKETPNGVVIETGDMLGHRRLQVDARKWKASKLAPKKYGDKVDVTSGDKPLESAKITIVHNDKEVSLEDTP